MWYLWVFLRINKNFIHSSIHSFIWVILLVVMVEHQKQWVKELVVRWRSSGSWLGNRVYLGINGERIVSVLLDQFSCTVVKRGTLLFRMRRGCTGQSIIWPGWCLVWDWLIRCHLMFFRIGWVLLWRSKIWLFKAVGGGMFMSSDET